MRLVSFTMRSLKVVSFNNKSLPSFSSSESILLGIEILLLEILAHKLNKTIQFDIADEEYNIRFLFPLNDFLV